MMMRGATVLLAFCVQGAVGVAFAQDAVDEASRRKSVLPSIRAARECIAREALNERAVRTASDGKQFRAALTQPMRRCADELDAMVAMHDSVYSPGAGEAFFQGPFLKTLPQAVRQRIAPKPARRAPEAETSRVAPVAPDNAALVEAKPLAWPSEFVEEEKRRAAAEPEPRPIEDTREAPRTAEPSSREVPARELPAREFPSHEPPPREPAARAAPAQAAGLPPAPPRPPSAAEVGPRPDPQDGPGSGQLVVLSILGSGVLGLGIVGLVLRGASRAVRNARRRKPLRVKYGSADIANRILSGKMWTGMTAEMLRDSWGDPTHVRRQVHKTRTTEIWRYVQTGRQRFKNRITLENGVVIGFEHL
ncbi:hypothetical protein [Methylobacterium currus]|uniref:hypothetical protein n=1 Tax=Methylobacterium currus TaxID=2051553 RepID=UPI00158029A0|nr:hypothetical protein [Methylobacterium currus]